MTDNQVVIVVSNMSEDKIEESKGGLSFEVPIDDVKDKGVKAPPLSTRQVPRAVSGIRVRGVRVGLQAGTSRHVTMYW